jgi:hypothetical protein
MANSPLGTIPNQIIRESFPEIPKKFAGIPQLTTLVIIATIVRITKNQTRVGIRVLKSAITSSEAKNIAEKIIWRHSVPFRNSLEWMSCILLQDITAIHAPIIQESPVSSATSLERNAIIMVKITRNSGYFLANSHLSSRSIYRRTTKIPNAAEMTIYRTALMIITVILVIENDPDASCVIMVTASKPRISSITAAPIITFAASACSLPISFYSLTVIALHVAERAVPICIKKNLLQDGDAVKNFEIQTHGFL